ncbi:DedA family protein [Mesorhizobium xinjiangense]|uniref:DedA family protein n=1 Tax=Mesorhizobium xinjiangense TaxID=2678685 RepID=UPI0012EDFB45|nr:VTT domain-containing protein [Mesorhizobium xinjiangense]
MHDPLALMIALMAAHGCLALFSVALVERLLPILPSSLLFVSLGVGAASGHWPLATAAKLSVAGSLIGGLALYGAGRNVDMRLLCALAARVAAPFGLGRERVEQIAARLRSGGRCFTFLAQHWPTARVIAPAISGAVQVRLGVFLPALLAGVVLWNCSLIFAGYAAARLGGGNSSLAALLAVSTLLAAQLAWFAWRRRPRRRLPPR